MAGAAVAAAGALEVVGRGPSGPQADTGAFLFLLAGTVGVGATLVGAFVLSRNSLPPRLGRGPSMDPPSAEFGEVVALAVVADLLVAVLALLGAVGVVHLSLVRTVAWGCVGVGLGVLAAIVLFGLFWVLAGIAGA